jgi:hypothetical protein
VSADVTVAVAGDPSEADEIRAVLRRAGIDSRIEGTEALSPGPSLDGPCRVVVAGELAERALEALEDDDNDEDEDDDE